MPGLLAVLGVVACVMAQTPSAYPYSSARRGCTQEDAPAVEIYLVASPVNGPAVPTPHIRIEIAALPGEPLSPTPIVLTPLRRDGASLRLARAALIADDGTATWLAGQVTVRQAGDDLSGTLDVNLPEEDGQSLAFSARLEGPASICG